jgi:hypothetical protein
MSIYNRVMEKEGRVSFPKLRETPAHYQNNTGYDVIEFCNAYGLNFNRGNIVKYVCRAGKKEDEVKDLKKAIEYLQRELEFIQRENQ